MRDLNNPPSEIGAQESIGRRLFSRNAFSRNGGLVKPVAYYQPGTSRISVDRLDYAPSGYLKNLAHQSAKARGENRNFHGWAKLTCEEASEDGRRVEADPIKDNPYHAIIHLPAAATDDDAEEQAHKLARLSEFIPPEWSPELDS